MSYITSRYTKIKRDSVSYKDIPEIIILNSPKDIYILWDDAMTTVSLANTYYKSPKYWWAIMSANKVFIEKDFKIGQTVRIPPLESVLGAL